MSLLQASAPAEPEKTRVLNRLKQIAKNLGVRFRRERVKWTYYDLYKKAGADAFAAPWELSYPIDKEHVRAAWNYFNKPANRAFYNSKERKIIMERIVRAALKHGIKLSYDPKDPLHRSLPDSLKKHMQASNMFHILNEKYPKLGMFLRGVFYA
ncbi:MAG: hypothetical protein QW069_09020 [Candidatus Caldarchaeum sp.]